MTVQLLLSFDDATSHNMRAVGLLEKHGLKAWFYLDTDGFSREMGDIDIRNIFPRHEIGGHTVTHSNLLELDHEREAWEVAKSKKSLKRLLKKPIESFAYPYGLYDAKIKTCFLRQAIRARAKPFDVRNITKKALALLSDLDGRIRMSGNARKIVEMLADTDSTLALLEKHCREVT